MAQSDDRERFIPFRKSDIVAMCLDGSRLEASERDSFRSFCKLLQSLFHFEFQEKLETLKDAYAPFDHDADTRSIRTLTETERAGLQKQLVAGLIELLEAANYERITARDLELAMREESLFKIRLHVDFEDFEEVIFFRRGESTRRETVVSLFGLRKRELEFTNYDRVAIFVKFKEQVHFDRRVREQLFFEPGATIIKLFQDVPKADIEMLFPNTEVRMKPIDKLLIGVPAAVGGVVVLATKLLGTVLLIGALIAAWLGLSHRQVAIDQKHLIALGVGLATLAAYVFKQVGKFKNRKIKFMKALSDNLYFKNLDNNAGVFHHLLDAAEEEECKEAILAYSFLLSAERDLDEQQLDKEIEGWFEERWQCRLDFEVGDALGKLERLGLVHREGAILRVLALEDAKAHLDEIWDNYFDYNRN